MNDFRSAVKSAVRLIKQGRKTGDERMKMSWKDMSVGEFPLVEPGMYSVRITSVERCVSSLKKTPQIEVKGLTDDDKSVVDYLALTEAAQWRIGQALVAVGMSEETLKALPDCDTTGEEFFRIMSLLKGRTVNWDITQETWEGRTRNKVAAWISNSDSQDPLVYEDNVPGWVKSKVKKAGLV